MSLADFATIRTGFPEADFWIQRRGTPANCGRPSRTYNPESIGIKVTRLDLLDPTCLFVLLTIHHRRGYFRPYTLGSLALQHIRLETVRRFPIPPGVRLP